MLTRQSVPPVDPRVSRLDCPRAQPVRLRTVYIVRTQALNAVQPAFLEWGRVFRARVPRVPRVLLELDQRDMQRELLKLVTREPWLLARAHVR